MKIDEEPLTIRFLCTRHKAQNVCHFQRQETLTMLTVEGNPRRNNPHEAEAYSSDASPWVCKHAGKPRSRDWEIRTQFTEVGIQGSDWRCMVVALSVILDQGLQS